MVFGLFLIFVVVLQIELFIQWKKCIALKKEIKEIEDKLEYVEILKQKVDVLIKKSIKGE